MKYGGGEQTSARLQAPEESPMKALPPLLPKSSMPTIISLRESWSITWALRHPQFATYVDSSSKSARVRLAQGMPQKLTRRDKTNYDHRMMQVASWDDVDEIERLSHFQEESIFAILSNEISDYKIVTLPKRQKVNSTFFIEYVFGLLTELCYPQRRKSHERRAMVNCVVQEYWPNVGFRRRKTHHPSDSPYLAPCDFFLFLFGAIKENFSAHLFHGLGEFWIAVESFLSAVSEDFLQTVFQEWIWGLQVCCDDGEECFE
jgi:hypothetical protein